VTLVVAPDFSRRGRGDSRTLRRQFFCEPIDDELVPGDANVRSVLEPDSLGFDEEKLAADQILQQG